MVAEPLGHGAKTEKVPHEWLKPFELNGRYMEL